jgi:hypothetical protein
MGAKTSLFLRFVPIQGILEPIAEPFRYLVGNTTLAGQATVAVVSGIDGGCAATDCVTAINPVSKALFGVSACSHFLASGSYIVALATVTYCPPIALAGVSVGMVTRRVGRYIQSTAVIMEPKPTASGASGGLTGIV